MRRVLVGALALVIACTSDANRAGPLRFDIPQGWQVTRRSADSVQLADGDPGRPTQSGSARVVVDIWWDSEVEPAELLKTATATGEVKAQDGSVGIIYDSDAESTAGKRRSILFAKQRILMVYRSAFPFDDPAFESGLDELRAFVSSVRVSGSKAA